MWAPILATSATPTGQPRPPNRLPPAWLLSASGSNAERPGLENPEPANRVDRNAHELTMGLWQTRRAMAAGRNERGVPKALARPAAPEHESLRQAAAALRDWRTGWGRRP
jgi:hypothetical protein